MSNLLSSEFLSAFVEIDKITKYLESEEKKINSKPIRKYVNWILMGLLFIFFPMSIFFDRGKRGKGISFADQLGYAHFYDMAVWILLILIALAFLLYGWYLGSFSFIFKKRERVTLEPVFKQLCEEKKRQYSFNSFILIASAFFLYWGYLGSFSFFFKKGGEKKHQYSSNSTTKVISCSKDYLIYLTEFLEKHKPASQYEYTVLKKKIIANMDIIRLCAKLLIYLKKDIKSSLIPDFDNKLFKLNRDDLKDEIKDLIPILHVKFRAQCGKLISLKDENPGLVQLQAEKFLSNPVDQSQVPRVLRFLDFLAAS